MSDKVMTVGKFYIIFPQWLNFKVIKNNCMLKNSCEI